MRPKADSADCQRSATNARFGRTRGSRAVQPEPPLDIDSFSKRHEFPELNCNLRVETGNLRLEFTGFNPMAAFEKDELRFAALIQQSKFNYMGNFLSVPGIGQMICLTAITESFGAKYAGTLSSCISYAVVDHTP